MDTTSPLFRKVELLVRALPSVANQPCFALKGGTAINFFLLDMPRLSIDIDLVYLPIEDRKQVLYNIDKAMKAIKEGLEASIMGSRVQITDPLATDSKRLRLEAFGNAIKIETSPVMRGTVWKSTIRPLTRKIQKLFGPVKMKIASKRDVYAGKICAALSRQHPRDLFDIKHLFDNEGIDRDLFKTFLVYLISDRKPIADMLSPRKLDISHLYRGEFSEMIESPIPLDELLDARERLISDIHCLLTDKDRAFLLSFKSGNPDWNLLDIEGVQDLPAVKWKLLNLDRISPDSHAKACSRLRSVLGGNTRLTDTRPYESRPGAKESFHRRG